MRSGSRLISLSGLLLAPALLLGACASQAPQFGVDGTHPASRTDLACTLPTNCIDSLSDGAAPLSYSESSAQAMKRLRATLATFPESTILRGDADSLEAIFTTPAGFRDLVEFRIFDRRRQIDFRSKSTFGLFDFGKNRSRIKEFAARYERQSSD